MKTSTKKVKPAFIVDLTNAETAEDVKFEFVRAKALAGVKITDEEINSLVKYGNTLTLNMIDSLIEQYCAENKPVVITDKKLVGEISKFVIKKISPKKPWYKRFWGWVTKPFKKN